MTEKSKFEVFVDVVQEMTGNTGKELMLDVFSFAGVMAFQEGNVEAFKHFRKRFREVSEEVKNEG